MSNETGKEIYKEYVNKWIDCETHPEKDKTNSEYDFWGMSVIKKNDAHERESFELWMIDEPCNFKLFTRAPKTQMINGHEVVAPRYDEFDINTIRVFIYLPMGGDGVSEVGRHCSIQDFKNIEKFGWFDSEQNALAYAKAHRESK